MNSKKWILNGLYLLITLLAFSLSLFKLDNPVWIAAWIAPVFLMRFMRTNKWVFAVVSVFITLQVAVFVGLLPLMAMTEATSIKVDFAFMFSMLVGLGVVFSAPLTIIPFILDKILYKRLPKWAASLVYPSGVVVMDFWLSLTSGTMNSFGVSQFVLPPLVMIASVFGFFGLSFLVAWFASMINLLWEEEWDIKKLGFPGLVYVTVAAVMLVYGGLAAAFPAKAEKTVPVAGITLQNDLYESMSKTGLYVSEILNLNPSEYAKLMNSPQAKLDEMRQKTREAVKAGAKIIVWQEYALALEASAADAYLAEMKDLADENDVYLLVSYARILSEKEKKAKPEKNISVLFTPQGNAAWVYAKALPSPGWEDLFVEAGPRDIPCLDTSYGRIGQVICADMLLPGYIRQAAAKNIDLLFVPSLDALFFTPLFAYSSAYRAVENGFTMVKITGDGQSAVIDPYYRLWAGQNFLEQGSKNFYANVPVVSIKTFYAAIGFVFPFFILLLLISLIVLSIIRAVKKKL